MYCPGRSILVRLSKRYDFIAKLLAEDFDLEYERRTRRWGCDKSPYPGSEPFAAEFGFYTEIGQPYCDNIRIPEFLHRKRIGITIYLFVRALYKAPIFDFWKDDKAQTAAGKAFWEKWRSILTALGSEAPRTRVRLQH